RDDLPDAVRHVAPARPAVEQRELDAALDREGRARGADDAAAADEQDPTCAHRCLLWDPRTARSDGPAPPGSPTRPRAAARAAPRLTPTQNESARAAAVSRAAGSCGLVVLTGTLTAPCAGSGAHDGSDVVVELELVGV